MGGIPALMVLLSAWVSADCSSTKHSNWRTAARRTARAICQIDSQERHVKAAACLVKYQSTVERQGQLKVTQECNRDALACTSETVLCCCFSKTMMC